ncbi:DUF4307 domain-containing protein [Microbacterium sp. MEC084]|jgi:hypothetical protein|uniref:DUF4307 domain-containing protein n=1 Tax=unclassified Microbacterium TaxID=2609290 RepID=UPI0006FF131C|nr:MULTISPECIES: DUF4307 domain-containing protein [unclassified Microbacterium]KQZ05018.1 transcriptional regulator [Microbacterium sp. Root53]MCD1267660.1 DUF4307 domain-containing protein [Microbacterium sp. MEC084]
MTTQAELDDRYGRTADPARRRMLWGTVIAVAAAGIGWLGWTAVSTSLDAVSVDGLGYEVLDEHSVRVSFQLTAPPGRDVACAVQALDQEFGVVGWKIVRYEGDGGHAMSRTETVPTVAEATTGLVETCWVT